MPIFPRKNWGQKDGRRLTWIGEAESTTQNPRAKRELTDELNLVFGFAAAAIGEIFSPNFDPWSRRTALSRAQFTIYTSSAGLALG